ncbi:MAG TPA: hypothetical protein VFE46_03215 [Pirellulales bacterium]|jgi:hypothetical protein|nr:hypothetical protein [Pirellulales bacterium]
MSELLSSRLHALRVDHLLRAAETIRDWPQPTERMEHAIRHIREAMYFCTVSKITHAEESLVYSILAFAMPEGDCAVDEG